MNRQEYRAAIDAAEFSPDFQARAMARLEALHREKECFSMKRTMTRGLIAACLIAALAVTASAAALLLSPQDVAEHVGYSALAAAFAGSDAVILNEAAVVGDYDARLMGLVSGEGLADARLEKDRTYAVLSLARRDGTAITDNVPELTVTPLVEGFAPWEVNAWTLNGCTVSFTEDGVLYYLLECDALAPYTDHEVFLAVYPGTHKVPSAEIFSFGEDGGISFQPGQDGVLFRLLG